MRIQYIPNSSETRKTKVEQPNVYINCPGQILNTVQVFP